jgi:hypothetical protein
MFRRDGAVVPQDNLVDRLVHLAPAREELHGIGANGLAHVEVDIAVAEIRNIIMVCIGSPVIDVGVHAIFRVVES